MIWASWFRHKRFLLRSYALVSMGLLAVATILDASFAFLQAELGSGEHEWPERVFRLIEVQLENAPQTRRQEAVAEVERATGLSVEVLPEEAVATNLARKSAPLRVSDTDGTSSYVWHASSLNAFIRVSPIEPTQESIVLRLLPPLFYVSIFVIVGLWLRPVLRDLNVITHAAQRFAADYREPLRTAERTSQLKDLATNLDEMSRRLSNLIQSQKELTTALSHEIRTPLARMRFALAVIPRSSSEEIGQQLDAMSRDIEEIDRLIASILGYARLDHPDQAMAWQTVQALPWLEETTNRCRQPSIELSVVCAPWVEEVSMDPHLMGVALSNLIGNAGQHARAKIVVTMRYGAGQYELTVEDDGDGVPASEREAIFKAFARRGAARRSHNVGGAGVGLAIVARVAALHDGAVAVDDSRDLGGARFVLTWPERLPSERSVARDC